MIILSKVSSVVKTFLSPCFTKDSSTEETVDVSTVMTDAQQEVDTLEAEGIAVTESDYTKLAAFVFLVMAALAYMRFRR